MYRKSFEESINVHLEQPVRNSLGPFIDCSQIVFFYYRSNRGIIKNGNKANKPSNLNLLPFRMKSLKFAVSRPTL